MLQEVCKARKKKVTRISIRRSLAVKRSRKMRHQLEADMGEESFVFFSKKGNIVPYLHSYAEDPAGSINCSYRMEKNQLQSP